MTTSGPLTVRAQVERGGFSLDVDLRIDAGSTVALVGPNGAGKSTLLGVIAGLIDPSSESQVFVAVGDRVLHDTTRGTFVVPEQRRVGTVFQEHRLFDHMSVLDNVAFGPRSSGLRRAESRDAARRWLDLLDVAEFAARRPRQLSGGQAQRVAIARTLAAEPDVLLLDEPLAALDVTSRSDVRRVLRRELDGFAGPRLVVTHDPSDAFLLADRLCVLEGGRISQSGTPDEIRRAPSTPYVAALTGTNLYAGHARDGVVALDDHDHTVTISDRAQIGAVLVTIHPTAVSLHPERPAGSQRNSWEATVELVEPLGDTVRVSLGGPIPVAADVTAAAVASLDLVPGRRVWVAVKATETVTSPA
jgi:molybdate transport system ATP-binding protein